MSNESNVRLTIAFNDPEADAEERETAAQNLLHALKELDEVESVSRVSDPHPPEGNKSLGGFLIGLLRAEVTASNFKQFMGFLGDRLGNKPIELEVEGNGKKLKLKASSREELEAAIEQAQKFIAS